MERNWANLHPDCVKKILSRLTMKNRWEHGMLICKPWFKAFKDPSLHSVFDLEPYIESSLPDMIRYSDTKRMVETKMNSMLRSVVQWSHVFLTQIRIRLCHDNTLLLVAERCPKLEVLSIPNSPQVTDESITRIALGCPLLKELDISFCHHISHKALRLVGEKCPNLAILKRNVIGAPGINWEEPSHLLGVQMADYLGTPHNVKGEVAAIANLMHNLVWLELKNSMISVEGLSSISQGCPKLELLNLQGCYNLSTEDIINASRLFSRCLISTAY